MTAFAEDGTKLTKAGVQRTTVNNSDPLQVLGQDVYEKFYYDGEDSSGGPDHGPGVRLKWAAGTIVRQSEIDALFSSAAVPGALSPTGGTTAGGTVVTINGTGLDGVSGVTFGGTPGTNLQIISPTQIKITTPAHASGAVTVVVQDDGGDVTKAAAFTYA